MEEKRPTRRRWFQFSLRTFLVVIMLVAFGGGWLGMQLQQKRRHEAAVKEITKLGGNVFLLDDGEVPGWKEWIFGSYAVRPLVLNLYETDATDSMLTQTQGMKVHVLDVGSTKVTDGGLTHLNEWASLVRLNLDNTQVTDAGLTHLNGLYRLEWLLLDNTQVTDAGLPHLKELTNLEYLFLRNTQVTDTGLESLHEMKSLRKCFLESSSVTQAGVDRLQKAIPDCYIKFAP